MGQYLKEYEYEEVPKKNGKGTRKRWIYVGDQYTLTGPEEQVKKSRWIFPVTSLLAGGLHFLSVMQDVPSNVGGLVGVPAGLALLPLIAVAYGSLVGLLVKPGVPMEKTRYQETAMCRRIGSSVSVLLMAYCAVALAVYTMIYRESVPVAQELLIAGGYVVVAVLMMVCYRTEKALTYQMTPGKNRATPKK